MGGAPVSPNDAVADEDVLLSRNPAAQVKLPKDNATGDLEGDTKRGAKWALSAAETERFIAAVKQDRLSALWLLLLTGGLRPGEAFALKWDDVVFEQSGGGKVYVRASLTRSGVDRKKYPEGWRLTKPKTTKSIGWVALPSDTMAELRRWRTSQKEARLAAGPAWRDYGFVFTTRTGTPLKAGNVDGPMWARVCEAAGLGEYGPEPPQRRSGPRARRTFRPSHRMYDLRHTCATRLWGRGVDIAVISRLLRHSTIKLTFDTYTGDAEDREGETAQVWQAIMAR